MPTPLLICIKAVNGGLFVALFAVLGEMLRPKRFAGIFGASPAVALANLLVIALAQGDASARNAATGMIAGAVALAVACTAAIPAVRRWGAVWGSAVLWGVWVVVGGAAAVPVAGEMAAGSATGLPAGGRVRRRPKTGGGVGSDDGRLFAVDFGSLPEIRPGALALRFAFGAAISVVAGLVGVVAGKRVGGVMLAASAGNGTSVAWPGSAVMPHGSAAASAVPAHSNLPVYEGQRLRELPVWTTSSGDVLMRLPGRPLSSAPTWARPGKDNWPWPRSTSR